MREAVVVSSSRTPLAKSFRGSFNMTRPDDLAAHCIKDALGMAWGRQGIRVNCIAPGPIETEGYLGVLTKQDPAAAKKAYDAVANRTGMGRWGKVHEIAYPCIFLASEASAFMNGATIIVDGGPSAREGDEAS